MRYEITVVQVVMNEKFYENTVCIPHRRLKEEVKEKWTCAPLGVQPVLLLIFSFKLCVFLIKNHFLDFHPQLRPCGQPL